MADEQSPAEADAEEEITIREIPDRGYVYVTDAAGLAAAIDDLSNSAVLGIDTESDSFFSHTESCCLIQVTGVGTADYVIDPLRIDDLSPLGPLFGDPSRVKIFHGADYDVVSMKRDFGFRFPNLFDTMIAAQATAHERFGLNDLVGKYFGVKLNKKWQRHDWSSRPLRPEHLDYARNDSRFLPVLRGVLMEQAEARGRTAMLEEEFALLEQREWTGRPFRPDDCMKIKGSAALDPDQRKILRSLFVLRESIAEARNRPPFKVWGNDVMLKVGLDKPADGAALRKLLGERHHVVRRYSSDVMEAVHDGVADGGPTPEVPRAVSVRNNPGVPPYTRDDEPLMAHLKKWRNRHSRDIGLAPAMVVNNAILKEVSALKPKTLPDLDAIGEMRCWQKSDFGLIIVDQVQAWLKANPEAGEKRGRRRRRRRRRGGGEDAPAPTAAAESD